MAILLNFGASCDRLKTVSRRIPEMNVKGWHSSFNIALELLKTPLEVVSLWIRPVLGYQTARKLLKDRFGHPFKIATAHVNQVPHGPAVKPNDQRGLKTFADQLQDCKNVLESIGYLDEVNSADNLSIVCPSIWKLNGLTLPTASKSPVSVLEFIIFQSSSLKRPVLLRIPSLEVRLIVTKTNGKKDRSGKKISPLNSTASSHATHGNFSGPGSCVPNPRQSIIRDARLCDNCFKVGHFATGCMQKSGCYIEGCNGNTWLSFTPLSDLYLQGKSFTKFKNEEQRSKPW